jgi:hypothetical protein
MVTLTQAAPSWYWTRSPLASVTTRQRSRPVSGLLPNWLPSGL